MILNKSEKFRGLRGFEGFITSFKKKKKIIKEFENGCYPLNPLKKITEL